MYATVLLLICIFVHMLSFSINAAFCNEYLISFIAIYVYSSIFVVIVLFDGCLNFNPLSTRCKLFIFLNYLIVGKDIIQHYPVNIIIALNPTYAREIRRINHPNTQIWPLIVGPLTDS